jgi:hypothetical protein
VASRSRIAATQAIGIDATVLEANAGMNSTVRRDSEESYIKYLKCLAEAAGLESTAPVAHVSATQKARFRMKVGW